MSEIKQTGQKRLVIVSGRAHPQLALDVAAHLETDVVHTDARTFANGEIYARYDESVRGADVFIIQSMPAPLNEHVMESLIMVDALKRASVKRITVVLRSEEHTSELQSHRSISYAVFCLRSEERRVGKECTVVCRSRWSPYH